MKREDGNHKKPSGQRINACLERLEKIEEGFREHQTLMTLFESGLITGRKIVSAGDFNLITWSHSSDGAFSVGVLEKVRNKGVSFPEHEHEQRLWLLCSRGSAVISLISQENDIYLHQGDYVVIEPLTKHIIQAESNECVLLMVTIPADPGMNRCHEKR